MQQSIIFSTKANQCAPWRRKGNLPPALPSVTSVTFERIAITAIPASKFGARAMLPEWYIGPDSRCGKPSNRPARFRPDAGCSRFFCSAFGVLIPFLFWGLGMKTFIKSHLSGGAVFAAGVVFALALPGGNSGPAGTADGGHTEL